MIALYGNIAGDRAILNCLQKSRSGEEGFRFGLQGVLSDSTVTISMFPENPTFGSRQWSVNPDNHIVYHIGKDIHADCLLYTSKWSTGRARNLRWQPFTIGCSCR